MTKLAWGALLICFAVYEFFNYTPIDAWIYSNVISVEYTSTGKFIFSLWPIFVGIWGFYEARLGLALIVANSGKGLPRRTKTRGSIARKAHDPEKMSKLSMSELTEKLHSGDVKTRLAITEALQIKAGQESVALLLEMLDDDEEFVRIYAARALGRVADANALEQISEARNTVKPDRRFYFDDAITQIRRREAKKKG